MEGGGVPRSRLPLSLKEVMPGSDNERLGVARDSMLCNPRILKAEVGKPRRNCYPLPGFDFSYGLYIHGTDGVPEAIGHWNVAKPSTIKGHHPRDFITMNRGAVKDGCTTAPEFYLYYKEKDIRCKDNEYYRLNRSLPKVPPDFTYGTPPRPSTPFYDLFQHKYKELWMEQQRALTAALRKEKKKSMKARDNRASLLRKYPEPMQEESFWHLPSLEKVEPHLSTFPDQNARKKAFSASH